MKCKMCYYNDNNRWINNEIDNGIFGQIKKIDFNVFKCPKCNKTFIQDDKIKHKLGESYYE